MAFLGRRQPFKPIILKGMTTSTPAPSFGGAHNKLVPWKNRKPPLGTQLNTGHPLAQNMIACWAFNESVGLTVKNNYPSTQYNLAVGSTGNFSWGVTQDGPMLTRPATSNNQRCSVGNGITSGTTFSIAARIIVSAITSTGYGTILATNNGSAGFFIKNNSSNYFLNWFQSTDHISTNQITLGSVTDILLSVSAGTGTFYINGIKDPSTVSGITSQILTAIFSDTASDALGGSIIYEAFWAGRALSATDAMQLYTDPYSVFTPQKRRIRNGTATATVKNFPPFQRWVA